MVASLSERQNPERRKLPVLGASEEIVIARAQPRVRGELLLRHLEGLLLSVERRLWGRIPERLNPMHRTGAVSVTCFLIATLTGVLLLFWYKTSVHEAYDSVTQMALQPLGGGLVRSLHRYSSDGCVLFATLHAGRMLVQRRVIGARWLAWVTGAVLIASVGFIGWTGYWLVWDERAHAVALASARALDVLPIFSDPLSREFLADAHVSSLLFFVVFFIHMLVPLALGVLLWVHVSRQSRPQFLAEWGLCAAVLITLFATSILLPADVADRAAMARHVGALPGDAWFLWPIVAATRMGAVAFWGVMVVPGAILSALPWLLRKGADVPTPATVTEARCNACEKCVVDCPYGAIALVPRTDGRDHPSVAKVIDDRCVGCGICAGSCDSAGIGIPWLDAVQARASLDRELQRAPRLPVVFLCAEASARLGDAQVGQALTGTHVMPVPCAGWVHPLLIERVMRHGASGVGIVHCAPGSCVYREGAQWTHERMAGIREPALRIDKILEASVLVRSAETIGEVREMAVQLARRKGHPLLDLRRPWATWLQGVGAAAMFAGIVMLGSRAPLAAEAARGPELVVSFKTAAARAEACRPTTREERERTAPHMRTDEVCERQRGESRLRVVIDDALRLDKPYAPSGLWRDGATVAIERIPVDPGKHSVSVELTGGSSVATFAQSLVFRPGGDSVVLYDPVSGFRAY